MSELKEQAQKLEKFKYPLIVLVIGVVLMFALCAISAFDSATVGNLLVYMGLWLVPVILLNFSLKR